MRYDTVLFDLDGTLTQSAPGILKSVRYGLEKEGLPPASDEELLKFIGPPIQDSLTRILGFDQETALRLTARFRERYNEIGWRENSVYEGCACLLRSLKKNGARLKLITGKPQLFAERIADYFDLTPYFDEICGVTMDEVMLDKSVKIKRAAGSGHACYVGDRAGDIWGAKGAGVDAIGVLYGYGSEEELRGAGADALVRTPFELTDYLLCGDPVAEGPFITFEGTDGCGKTTQIAFAEQYLKERGHVVVRTREPGGCEISEKIRALLLDASQTAMTSECEALLFAAARAQHAAERILPAKARGETVLCDRYVDSSCAYQGGGRGLAAAKIMEINRFAMKGCLPDLTIFLDLDPRLALARRMAESAPDRIEREKLDFVCRVRDAFWALVKAEPDRVRAVDGTGTPEEVFDRVKHALHSLEGGNVHGCR